MVCAPVFFGGAASAGDRAVMGGRNGRAGEQQQKTETWRTRSGGSRCYLCTYVLARGGGTQSFFRRGGEGRKVRRKVGRKVGRSEEEGEKEEDSEEEGEKEEDNEEDKQKRRSGTEMAAKIYVRHPPRNSKKHRTSPASMVSHRRLLLFFPQLTRQSVPPSRGNSPTNQSDSPARQPDSRSSLSPPHSFMMCLCLRLCSWQLHGWIRFRPASTQDRRAIDLHHPTPQLQGSLSERVHKLTAVRFHGRCFTASLLRCLVASLRRCFVLRCHCRMQTCASPKRRGCALLCPAVLRVPRGVLSVSVALCAV